jgi:hypothetical protein
MALERSEERLVSAGASEPSELQLIGRILAGQTEWVIFRRFFRTKF